MLRINDAQRAVLDQVQFADFEERALQFLEEMLPEAFIFSGRDRMRQTVRVGQQRGLLLDFTTEREMIKYLYLRQLLGADVDTNPAFPWLRALLNDQALEPEERLDRALRAVSAYLDTEDQPRRAG